MRQFSVEPTRGLHTVYCLLKLKCLDLRVNTVTAAPGNSLTTTLNVARQH